MPKSRVKLRSPSFRGLAAANSLSSRRAAQGSAKRNTRPEVTLQRHLKTLRLRFRVDAKELPGRPDVVFDETHVAVFVDGDFWHGRNLAKRMARLAAGHNADYWMRKILANRARDRRSSAALRRMGWKVIRIWEGDIKRDVARIAEKIATLVGSRAAAGRSGHAIARKRAAAP